MTAPTRCALALIAFASCARADQDSPAHVAAPAKPVPGAIVVPAPAPTPAAGDGQVRDVGEFRAIEAGGAFEIEVTVGPATRVEVTGDPDEIARVTTTVRDQTLHLGMGHGSFHHRIHIAIATPHLMAVETSGADRIRVAGIIDDPFAVSMSGAGDITLAGTTKTASYEISGAGNIDASKLVAQTVAIDASGAGAISADAREIAAVDVSGVGSVELYGHPAHVTRSISGFGSIDVR